MAANIESRSAPMATSNATLEYRDGRADALPPRTWRTRALRTSFVAAGLALWFFTQWLIGTRGAPPGIGDGLHELTAGLNRHLLAHPDTADALLLVSSAMIDALALFLLGWAVFGPSIRPFLGLLLLFALRQVCQGLCTLPPPQGMIWRAPFTHVFGPRGFPSLLVTYGVSNDLFFSGHTALAVYGAVTLGQLGRRFALLGAAIAAFEIVVVIVLRAHYTMDVFTGAVTALWVALIARILAPPVDRALRRLS